MKEEIKNRLVEIRKTLGIKQIEFADRMGLKQSSWASIESGSNPFTDRYIKLVCLTFGVNEEWLRTGTGDMLISEASGWQELLDTFHKLSPEMRKAIREIAHTLLAADEARTLPVSVSEAPSPDGVL